MENFRNIPKEGQKFAFNAYNISDIVVREKSENNYILEDNKTKNELLKYKYLIFTYLGSGLAREYFSSKIFNIVMSDNFDEVDILNQIPSFNKKDSDLREFYEGYKIALKYPLLIHTSTYDYSNQIFEVDSKIIDKIMKDSEESQIVEAIEELEKSSREKLINEMNKIINSNHEMALEENRRLKLKKTY